MPVQYKDVDIKNTRVFFLKLFNICKNMIKVIQITKVYKINKLLSTDYYILIYYYNVL